MILIPLQATSLDHNSDLAVTMTTRVRDTWVLDRLIEQLDERVKKGPTERARPQLERCLEAAKALRKELHTLSAVDVADAYAAGVYHDTH